MRPEIQYSFELQEIEEDTAVIGDVDEFIDMLEKGMHARTWELKMDKQQAMLKELFDDIDPVLGIEE